MVVAFNVTGNGQGDWAVLEVSGELDLVTSPVLRQRVHDEVAEGRHSLVLDLSDVFFCDSSGVGVLIASRRLMSSCQGRLRLILPAQGAEDGSHVNRVLGALGVHAAVRRPPGCGVGGAGGRGPAVGVSGTGA